MSDKTEVSRRAFLLAGASVVPFLGTLACAEEKKACRETEEGQYGPFYREGAPWRAKLCEAGEVGAPLLIEGRVTRAGTCEPLKGAMLDVWHASAAGFYDNNDPARPFDPTRYNLRGRIKTDDEGRYRFETILPGNYGQGRFTRAKHIHLLATCEGCESLVTEIYFEGDRHNETDGLVRRSLITRLEGFKHEKRDAWRGTFDIVLAKAR